MGFEYGPYRPGEQQIEGDPFTMGELVTMYGSLCAGYGLNRNVSQKVQGMILARFEALSERVAWLEQGGEDGHGS